MNYNILFLNQNFYQYDLKIKEKLIEKGNKVFEYNIKPDLNLLEEILEHCKEGAVKEKLARKVQRGILLDLKKKKVKIDIVFLTAGQMLLPNTLIQLKELYPNAEFVWYIWDNIASIKTYNKNAKYFSKIITFDKVDAENYNLMYLPLFYIYETKAHNKKYDINFVGHSHSDRKELLIKILEQNQFKNPYIYLLTGKYTRIIYLLFKKNNVLTPYLKLKPLKYNDMVLSIAESKCVLDFPWPGQTGLTMRTIETIGAHTKLITTNEHIKNYDFYRPENVYILDRDNMRMPDKSFYESPYLELEKEIELSYSIDSWIKKLIEHFETLYIAQSLY